jgi:hypothetical protein
MGRPTERMEWFNARGRFLAAWNVGELPRTVGAPAIGLVRGRLQAASRVRSGGSWCGRDASWSTLRRTGQALSPDLRGDTTSAKTFWWGLTDSDRWFARACTASRSRNTPGTRSATPRLSFRPSSFPTGRFAKPGARDEVRVLPSCRAHVLVLHRQGAARLRRSTAGSHSPGAATLPRLAGANRGDHRAYAGGGEWPSRRRRARSARGMGRAV